MEHPVNDGSNAIELLNPITKLLAILILGTGTLIFPSAWLGVLIIVGLVIVAGIADILVPYIKILISFGIPISIMLFFIQGLYSPKNKTIIVDFGFAELGKEGLMYAGKLIVTLLVFLSAFYIMNKTTYPGKMVAALMQSGMSPKIGYLILASLNVVSQMRRRMEIIKEAQTARGVEITGSLLTRIKAYLPLLGPVVMSSLTDAQERGMTLETRGFANSKTNRTSLIPVGISYTDIVIRRLLWLFFAFDLVITVLMYVF